MVVTDEISIRCRAIRAEQKYAVRMKNETQKLKSLAERPLLTLVHIIFAKLKP